MDFDDSQSKLAAREFLAVILAGFGNELLPLTGNNGDEPCPKALLPIANKPMIDYPLTWLEASGIRDVLLICPTLHRAALSNYINSDSSASSYPSLRIDLQPYDESENLSVGTCQILRHFSQRIQQDFLIMSCDYVPPPSLPLSTILNKFRTETTYDGALATALFFEQNRPDKSSSSEEWGAGPAAVPVVWEERTGTLLHVETPDDMDRNEEHLVLNMNLLQKFPRAKLSANLQDAHVYVCRRSVIDLLNEKSRLESLREEFIPWLCTPQYHPQKRAKYGHIFDSTHNAPSQRLALEHGTLYDDYLGTSNRIGNSAASSPIEDDKPVGGPSLRVGVVVHRASAGFTARANNLPSYLELNRHFLSQTSYTLPTDPESRSLIDPKAQISSDSMVGHTTKVGERTSIKKSVIGKHCVIGKSVKINGCVVLDHCTIADGAKLEGCILGTGTNVGAKAELVKCVTQAGYEVEEGGNYKHERLDVSDWTAAHDYSEDDSSEED
ncbi:UDP-3-O-glucosamine N-acyltransferase [Panus rudis PR-1116 ss-1]|nr:UDP-3-O-glucosamine N-acyltransferase [Panus rudis PR-1116 ss-1]